MVSLQIAFYLFYFVAVSVKTDSNFILSGIIVDNCDNQLESVDFSDELPIFKSGVSQEFKLFGMNITRELIVGFSPDRLCDDVSLFKLHVEDNHVAVLSFIPPRSDSGLFSETQYYFCAKSGSGNWTFLDDENFGFYVYEPLITTIPRLIILISSYALSSLMSGLNIGLFTLDPQELELLKGAGTAKEKKYARKILPVRRKANVLLCSILITATLCNAISTVVANQFLSAWFTVIITTIAIVLLCEILPQSVCTKYPLAIGAKTIYITRVCMLLTSPISYPLGKILHCLFGKESTLGTYNKERFQELLAVTQLATDEAKIIAGTLKLSNKTVEEIMTVLSDVFKLPITAVMDFETIALILSSGYSRVPIYVGDSSNIRYILLTKDLALLDPEDNVPVRVLVKNLKMPCHYVPLGTTVDKLFEIFKDGRSHMVFVVDESLTCSLPYSVSLNDEKKVVGLVTFEDVIEEIFQMEINDETDKVSDNRIKRKLEPDHDLISNLKRIPKASKPSANLKSAILSFLSSLDAFKDLSPRVLQSMLDLDIYYLTTSQMLPQDTIYTQGISVDYFVMILEGEMELRIGNENLVFQVGAFQYFGSDALKGPFIPDYTLQAVRKAKYLKINRTLYEAAMLATQYMVTGKSPRIKTNIDVYKYYEKLVG